MTEIKDIESYIDIRNERDKLLEKIEELTSTTDVLSTEKETLQADIDKLRKIIADNVVANQPTKETVEPTSLKELILQEFKGEE